MWKPIETAPPDVEVMLFCPYRNITNLERIEIGLARCTRSGSAHGWATHWAPLPAGPDPVEIAQILADEAEREHHDRIMEQLSHDGQL